MEALLIVLICGSVGVGWRVIRRSESPATYWVAGWVATGAGSMITVVRDEFPHAQFLVFPLGSIFPALLCAGACVLSARPLPRWLLPAALAYGLLRSAIAAAGMPGLAWSLALAFEPPLVLFTAWLVYRATPAGVSRSERWLAPSLVLLAALGAVHVAWLIRVEQIPHSLLAIWVVSVPALLGVQLHAEWERGRRALRRAQDQLERRVEERTAALRESEARYRVASELGSDLSFGLRVDRGGRFYDGWFSDAFPRITGYGVDELKAGGWFSIVHAADLPSARAQFAEILGGHSREMEIRLDTKDGGCITVLARLRVIEEPGGVLRIVGAARDITEMRRAAEERRALELRMFEAQRLESLAVLTGGVAHDFNNLLVVILGNSRAALAEAPPGSPLATRLSRVRAAAEHGARLTEQMLAYSGKSSLALKPIDLSQLVEEMADLLRASVSEHCRIALELAPRAPVEGDGTQLQQVLLNLVTNASEALGSHHGRVAVRTGRTELDGRDLGGSFGSEGAAPGAYAYLEVADDGPGMDAATRQRIFEPFFTTKFSGRGLGLAAVLGIVRAHHGVVRVASEPGRGTTICVLLPLTAAAVRSSAAPSPPPGRGTVLVVDDQDSVVEVAQLILQGAGHRALAAVGGRAGIEQFRARADEIDAVLLDLTMPDADGEEVLEALLSVRPDVRVIIATGYDAGTVADRVRSRVCGFVRKPYDPDALLAEVDRALAYSVTSSTGST